MKKRRLVLTKETILTLRQITPDDLRRAGGAGADNQFLVSEVEVCTVTTGGRTR